MATLLPANTRISVCPPRDRYGFREPSFGIHSPYFQTVRPGNFRLSGTAEDRSLHSRPATRAEECLGMTTASLRLATSAVLFLGLSLGGFGFGTRHCLANSIPFPPGQMVNCFSRQEESKIQDVDEKGGNVEKLEQKEMDAAFEAWKSKTYALTVPLRVVALRGSLPPSWIKDFIQSQGRRLKFIVKFNGNIEGIFNDLSTTPSKGKVRPSSPVGADVVSIGDSWLNFAIRKCLIEPIPGAEEQEWYKSLSGKWKVLLRRNFEGEMDPEGKIWAAPYRWGCMVIAYKKSKFQRNNWAPIEDWADLWRPELAGRISMVDSPREVIGAVLKFMGASYNTKNINLQVAGGKGAVQKYLASFAGQVRLFDSVHYLKAFSVGDTWVAVGWSSDVLPMAKRMSNIAVIVPKSGSSLWADLWAVPSTSRANASQFGGRCRGPSPLIHQWIEFCLQAARALPFKQEVVAGASPAAIENDTVDMPKELTDGKPRLDTNLVAGVPPPDILRRCEFLEPLPDSTMADYQWLISTIQRPAGDLSHRVSISISSLVHSLWMKLHLKVT